MEPARTLPFLTAFAILTVLAGFGVRASPRASADSSADSVVTWQKSPDHATLYVCDPSHPSCPDTPSDLGGGIWLNGVILEEIMNNQSDPHGLGGYQLDVLYDPLVFQPAVISDLGVLNDGGVRSTICDSVERSPGDMQIVCGSTGPFGQGAQWSGGAAVARVILKLQPGVYGTVQSGPYGGMHALVQDAVKVTNTCGQPLNDGSIVPIPGQDECQGNLLPGLSAGGIVLSPGSSIITILQPPTTPTPSSTGTRTPLPTSTLTAPTTTTTAAGTRTPTAAPPTQTRTAISGTSTATTPTRTTTSTVLPSTTTATIGRTRTPTTGSQTIAAAPSTTAKATSTSIRCPRSADDWETHGADWPVSSLTLAGATYGENDLLKLLATPASDNPNPGPHP